MISRPGAPKNTLAIKKDESVDLWLGVLDLDFTGNIDGGSMAGKVTLRGLPGGREQTLDFTGTRVAD